MCPAKRESGFTLRLIPWPTTSFLWFLNDSQGIHLIQVQLIATYSHQEMNVVVSLRSHSKMRRPNF